MRENDGRKLDHKTLEAIRIRAVKQVEAGESPEVIIRALGMTQPCIYKWLAKYREGGIASLKAKPLKGRPSKLKGSQIRWVYKTVIGKNPLQLKFKFALWTRGMISELIQNKYRIKLSNVSVGRLLRKLGLSCQKPLTRAYQQNPDLVDKWVKQDYPRIKYLAKRRGAEIFFSDEAGVKSDSHSGRTWSPIGKTPIIRTTGARFGTNLISAISSKGSMRFMSYNGKFNADKFCDFLKRLIHNANRQIFLIVDGHPTHRSAKVRKFVKSHIDKLRLYFLPPYSPELNPDELVWNNLKNSIGRSALYGPDDLKEKVFGHMKSLQKSPDKIISFFQEPNCKYAA